MKIGVRAHDYGKMEIEKLAEKLHSEGYEAAQLALPKAFVGIESYDDITMSHLERIRESFAKNNIDIPVFGCYQDLGNPDKDIRENAVRNLKNCLAFSKEVGAKVVGTETAYPRLNAEQKKLWHPYMLDSIKRVVDEAVKIDVRLAIEPVYWHPLDSLEVVLEVMDKVGDEEHLRMIFDASNLLEFPDKTNQEKFWSKWLDYTGKYIEAMHIKDFYNDANGQYQPTTLGDGVIDYSAISRWLHNLDREMYLLREEMNPMTAKKDIEYLKNM